MMNTKTKSKIMAAIIAGTVALSIGGVAFAATSTSTTTDGTVTTEQKADKGKIGFGKGHKLPMNEKGSMFKRFVTDGTITQDQADKIAEYMKTKREEQKAEFDKVKNMTKEERKAYLAQQKKEKTDILSELVTANLLSQDQSDKIKAKMPKPGDKVPMKRGDFGAQPVRQQDFLKSAVEKGTITQEKADKITAYMKTKMEEKKAEFDKIKDMTKEERDAYLAEKSKTRTDMFTDLVNQGIITQAEADALKADMPKAPGKPGDMHNKGVRKGAPKASKNSTDSSTKQSE